ncbi:hypothetical protein I553_5285 [Mycobacterium xenopi 4042]|uniref:Uncharacterized protein n=1 Tax=Mycobacterium xenopi 4042 TaxID=1299334 RepID=X7ZV27_MYCXE|nr:hypothetical protein I553_5285 [Mycobacterium xenopi 4042]
MLFSHEGHPCTPTVCCSTCGQPLSRDTLKVALGPGAAPAGNPADRPPSAA